MFVLYSGSVFFNGENTKIDGLSRGMGNNCIRAALHVEIRLEKLHIYLYILNKMDNRDVVGKLPSFTFVTANSMRNDKQFK